MTLLEKLTAAVENLRRCGLCRLEADCAADKTKYNVMSCGFQPRKPAVILLTYDEAQEVGLLDTDWFMGDLFKGVPVHIYPDDKIFAADLDWKGKGYDVIRTVYFPKESK